MNVKEKIEQKPISEQQLADWYSCSLGKKLAHCEQKILDEVLPDLFGYHLLQVGSIVPSLLSASRMLHKIIMSYENPARPNCDISGLAENLPVQPDCIDAVLHYHSLEFANDPRQVLRETERVLVPEGSVVIMGFNPVSMWGIRRILSRSPTAPWNGSFLSVNRLKDWLELLGFEIRMTQHYFFRPPVNNTSLLSRLDLMESWGSRCCPVVGGAYILIARKKVSTMTPIKPRWRPKRSVVSSLGDAASRSYKRNAR
ncbi:MAG: class I SAM-dependent methyltransferase [Gammaproteobacteria bacterium]|nr:class I SAM-dependent methyltransferase [Gammaproteobacteria bacterium]